MSNFDDLERQHADVLAELIAVLDIAGGIDDLLRDLERAHILEAVGDLLDLKRGASAALDAAGITRAERTTTDQEAESSEPDRPAMSHMAPESSRAWERYNADLHGAASGESGSQLNSVVLKIHSLDAMLLSLSQKYGVRARGTDTARTALAELALGLYRRELSHKRAIARVRAALAPVRRMAKKTDPSQTEKLEALIVVADEILQLELNIDQLFDTSRDFESSPADY